MSQTEQGKNQLSPETLHYCRYTTDHSPLPMVAAEGTSHIMRYVNPAFCLLTGKEKEELIGHPFVEVVPDDSKNDCVAMLDRVYRTGEAENLVEQEHSPAASDPVYWSYTVWAILDEEEHPRGAMIQVTDTTKAALDHLYREKINEEIRDINQELLIAGIREQEMAHVAIEAQQQLLQAQKMESIGRLAGGIAHDFNNLLTAILGYADLAEETLEANDEVQEYLHNIHKAAERASALTGQLLAFARKQVIEPKVVNLNTLILDMGKMLEPLLGEHIELVIFLEPDLGQVKIDSGQFGQVLMNLVVNARDAMPEGGTLTIETAPITLTAGDNHNQSEIIPGDYVLLTIRDTGMGMTEEMQAHLFEPFYTTKERGKGTGLGLATCYGVVKQSGGHIEVNSEPGKGTTFRIYLPRRIEAVVMTYPGAVSTLPSGSEVIFLVEDEAMVRYIGAQTLRRQGYTVFEAGNGIEALHLISSHSGMFDLLVTDVVMPQMGGKELVDRLRTTHPHVKVLYMSGYTDDAIGHQGILDPGLVFLQKPFTPTSLARKVREVLDRSTEESAF